jgi:hypothetical protein
VIQLASRFPTLREERNERLVILISFEISNPHIADMVSRKGSHEAVMKSEAFCEIPRDFLRHEVLPRKERVCTHFFRRNPIAAPKKNSLEEANESIRPLFYNLHTAKFRPWEEQALPMDEWNDRDHTTFIVP